MKSIIVPLLNFYESNEKIGAARILTVSYTAGQDGYIELDLPGQPRFTVRGAWILLHQPEPLGYYIVHEDGRDSYCPSKIFKERYKLIQTDPDKLEWRYQ